MSTKIYDAYVFDKNYSVAELNKMFVPIKGKIKEYMLVKMKLKAYGKK